jgi:hypothetical protein
MNTYMVYCMEEEFESEAVPLEATNAEEACCKHASKHKWRSMNGRHITYKARINEDGALWEMYKVTAMMSFVSPGTEPDSAARYERFPTLNPLTTI